MNSYLHYLGSILWLASTPAIARGDTRQSFDTPAGDTAYAHTDARTDESVQAPTPTESVDHAAPAPGQPGCDAISTRRLMEGERTFLRIAHADRPGFPGPNCNAVTFNCVDPGTAGEVAIELDFRVSRPGGATPSDGFSVSLLRVADELAPGAAIEIDEVSDRPAVAHEPDLSGSLGFGFAFDPAERVGIHWNGGAFVHAVPIPPGRSMAGAGWIHASIEIDFGRRRVGLRLALEDGSELVRVEGLEVPGLAPYASRVHVAARAGVRPADIDLDELVVAFPPGDPARVGSWSPALYLPAVPIHAALLPGGAVLYFDNHDAGEPAFLWDGQLSVPAGRPPRPEGDEHHEPFCGGHAFAADGSLVVAGGHVAIGFGQPWASRFDPVARQWSALPPMQDARWYPTVTTLPSGDLAVVSGDITPSNVNRIPEVHDARANLWRALAGADRAVPLYPFMFTTPRGLFAAGPMTDTGFLDVAGEGRWIPTGETIAAGRGYASAVLADAARGRILVTGGTQVVGGGLDTQRSTEWIDLSEAAPRWQAGPSMTFARRHHTATLLPDGSVIVTGGTSSDADNRADGAILNPELLTSLDDAWRPMACAAEARIYHSVALLLPDARVMVAGGGHPAEAENCDRPPCPTLDHPTAEIFSPPYLHRGPQLGAPAIAAGPGVVLGADGVARVRYGATIEYATEDPSRVAAVTWMRPAAVTHAFNQDQRLVRLDAGPRGLGAQAIAPGDPAIAPPGPYMMFLVDGSGVPSHAAWVRTNLPPDAADDVLERAEDREIPDLFERLLANDVDVERDPTSVAIVDPPRLGRIVDGAYVPLDGASGDDTFTYTLSDGLDTSRVATVTIRITPDGGGCGCAAGPGRGALLGSIWLVAAVAPLLARRRRSAR